MAALSDVILDCVIALMREGGAPNVSIRTVAARAQVSIGAVQHHFADKNALMLASLARIQEEFTSTVISSSAANDSLTERALRLARAVTGLNAEDLETDDDAQTWRDKAAARVSFAAYASHHESALEENTYASQDIEDVFYALIARQLGLTDAETNETRVAAVRLRAQGLLATAEGLAVAGACESGRVTPQIAGYLLEEAVRHAFAGDL